ncbi:hypothetical protein SAV31267_094320 [Streptomyces avermitilis]|uniref:PAS domain-containing protein n=1 Tax=Streptomyces avermitilis TaxID=33903 RepID=A0A4D4N9V4_STRAX|nr:hypothetical protein SAV31267_094320 [Streptomyces avermitilis]
MHDITFRGDGEFPEPGSEADVLLDACGRVAAWGPGAQQMLGCPAREAVGRSADEFLYDPADAADIVRRWEKGARRGLWSCDSAAGSRWRPRSGSVPSRPRTVIRSGWCRRPVPPYSARTNTGAPC